MVRRAVFSLATLGLGFAAAVGCSSSNEASAPAGADSSTVDSALSAADASTGAADSGASDRPACYNPQMTDAALAAASVDALTGYAYHDPMPKGSGCSPADAAAYETVFYSDEFLFAQYDLPNVSTVSASCKTCLLSEYDDAVNPPGTASTKWGWSGLRITPEGDIVLPSNPLYHNDIGCFERMGVLTNEEARAYHNNEGCLSDACPSSEDDTACGAETSATYAACVAYATSKGACAALNDKAKALAPKVEAAYAAGICASEAAIVMAFCGDAG